MLFIRKIVLNWWLRISLFIILSFLLFYLFRNTFPHRLIYFQIDIFLALLIPTLLLELPRFSIYRLYYGLRINRKSIINLSNGFLVALFVMSTLFLFSYILGLDISLNRDLDFQTLIFYCIMFFFIAFSEELLFRGVIFQTLIQRFHHNYIIIITSTIFAFAHIGNNHMNFISFINIFLAGMIFGFLILKKLDLWYCISFHFFWNFLQVLIMDSPLSGYNYNFSFFEIDYNNLSYTIELLLGNEFGIESGLITTFFMLIILWNIVYNMKIDFNKHKILNKRLLMERHYVHNSN